MKNKRVVSLSGGMDSATVLGWAKENSSEVLCVGFSYGSKHNPYELKCAEELCKHYEVELVQIDLREVGKHLKSNLLVCGGSIPEGHYEAECMKQTVVPGRNMIFISILTGIAQSRGFTDVAVGIHSGDHVIYADCRPEFFDAMRSAVRRGTDGHISLRAPFLMHDKTTILEYGYSKGVPYHLTRTCYKAQELSCGRCGACQERLQAFKAIGKEDPVEYEEVG